MILLTQVSLLTQNQELHVQITISYQMVGHVILLLFFTQKLFYAVRLLVSLFGTNQFKHIHAGYIKVFGFDSRVQSYR